MSCLCWWEFTDNDVERSLNSVFENANIDANRKVSMFAFYDLKHREEMLALIRNPVLVCNCQAVGYRYYASYPALCTNVIYLMLVIQHSVRM